MEEITLPAILNITPCPSNEIAAKTEDHVEDVVEKWLENEAFSGFRVWQLVGIVLSILLSIVIGFCCCIRFRVPRTKQEIEADYIRKKITKSFRHKLSKISNTDMDEMDLQKALDRVRNEFEGDTSAITKEYNINMSQQNANQRFRSRFNAVFTGIRIRFNQRDQGELSVMM